MLGLLAFLRNRGTYHWGLPAPVPADSLGAATALIPTYAPNRPGERSCLQKVPRPKGLWPVSWAVGVQLRCNQDRTRHARHAQHADLPDGGRTMLSTCLFCPAWRQYHVVSTCQKQAESSPFRRSAGCTIAMPTRHDPDGRTWRRSGCGVDPGLVHPLRVSALQENPRRGLINRVRPDRLLSCVTHSPNHPGQRFRH